MDVASAVVDSAFMGLAQRAKRPDSVEQARRMAPLGMEARRLPKDRPISAKWHMIMTMQLRNFTLEQIAKALSCHPSGISNITRTERYQLALRRRVGDLDDDLLSLKPLAIDALGDALRESDVKVRLTAAKEFFAVTGTMAYGKHTADPGNSVSPENLAKALVSAARAETTVNIHLASGAVNEVPGVQVSVGDGGATLQGGDEAGVSHRGLQQRPHRDEESSRRSEAGDQGQSCRVEDPGLGAASPEPLYTQMELALAPGDSAARGGVHPHPSLGEGV